MKRTTWCLILCVVATSMSLGAQSSPSSQPRLTQASFEYLGAFRLPRAAAGGDTFEFGGFAIALNPATNTLYATSRQNRVAEVTIPEFVRGDISTMRMADYVQPFADPTEGRLAEVGTEGVALRGLAVLGGRLCGSASMYYDAQNVQRVSHFCRSLTLATPSFSGWSSVWEAARTGYVAGPMAPLPAEWHARLRGNALTSNCCIPITWRTSQGPSAFAFDAALVGRGVVPANPLLYYTMEHPTLGVWQGSSPNYGGTTTIAGMAVVDGTRTALYVGRNGMGPFCYGPGLTNPGDPRIGQPVPDAPGETYCLDPSNTSKGQHAYPYRYQAWLYDLEELATARRDEPWSTRPYEVFTFDLPGTPINELGGIAYHAARRTLYVLQWQTDVDGYAYRPLIHGFRINASTAPAPTTTEDPRVTALQQQVTELTTKFNRLMEALRAVLTREQ